MLRNDRYRKTILVRGKMNFRLIPRYLGRTRNTGSCKYGVSHASVSYTLRITHNTSGGRNTSARDLSLRASFRTCDGMTRNVMKSWPERPVFKGPKNELRNERRHAATSYYVSWLSSRQDLLRNEAAVAFTLAGRVHARPTALSLGLDR